MACLAASVASASVLAPSTDRAMPHRLLQRTYPASSKRLLVDGAATNEEPASLRHFRVMMDERIRGIQNEQDDFQSFRARIEERIQGFQNSQLEASGSVDMLASNVLKSDNLQSDMLKSDFDKSALTLSPSSTATTASPSSEMSWGPPTPDPERHEPMCAIDDFTSMPEGLFKELLESGARARTRNQHMQIRSAEGVKRRELVQFDSCAFV